MDPGSGAAGVASVLGASTGAAPAQGQTRMSYFSLISLPAGAVVGSLVEGAAAVSVAVGFGWSVGVAPLVPGASVLVPAVPEGFLRLKMLFSLSMASSAGVWMFQTGILAVERLGREVYEVEKGSEPTNTRHCSGRSGQVNTGRSGCSGLCG